MMGNSWDNFFQPCDQEMKNERKEERQEDDKGKIDTKIMIGPGGPPQHRGSVHAPCPGSPGLNLGVPKIFLDVAELIDSKDSALKA